MRVQVMRTGTVLLLHLTVATGCLAMAAAILPAATAQAAWDWLLQPQHLSTSLAVLCWIRLIAKAWHNQPRVVVPRMLVELAIATASFSAFALGLAADTLSIPLSAWALTSFTMATYLVAMIATTFAYDCAVSKQDAEAWTFTLAGWLATFVLLATAVLAFAEFTRSQAF